MIECISRMYKVGSYYLVIFIKYRKRYFTPLVHIIFIIYKRYYSKYSLYEGFVSTDTCISVGDNKKKKIVKC